MLAVHKNGNRYSVCVPQGIVCQSVSHSEAMRAIASAVDGITETEIEELLKTPTPPEIFRTVWSQAVSQSLLELERDVESLPNSETVNDVLNRQTRLFKAVGELRRELVRSNLREKIREAETAVEAMADRYIQALNESRAAVNVEAVAWNHAMNSKLGKQLVELREQLNET